MEEAIYSVGGWWARPRWSILSFPQSKADLKEGLILKVGKVVWLSGLCADLQTKGSPV